MMVKRISNIVALLLLPVLSCTKQPVVDYGTISVSLSGEPAVKSYEPIPADEAASFNIAVYDADGAIQGSVRKFEFFESAKVVLGKTYYVTAESCTSKEAESGWGCLRLTGRSENTSLTKESPDAHLDVYCSVANAVFEYAIQNGVQEYLENISVKVVSSDNKAREMVPDGPGRQIWFNVSGSTALSCTITATSVVTGKTFEQKKEIIPEAGDHITITVKVESQSGQLASPVITVDSSMTQEESQWNFDIYDFE